MKKLLILLVTLLITSNTNGFFAQHLPLLKLDPEPLKPFHLETNALKELSTPQFINGKVLWIEETKADYEKRNTAHKKKSYLEYTESTEYKNWQVAHLDWRKNNLNWKEITIYPELLNAKERKEYDKPQPIIGENYNVTSKTLNIRTEPNKNSSILTTLNLDDEVKLIEIFDADWWLVEYNNIKGYAFNQFLKYNPMSGWEKRDYKSGTTPECENVTPQYDYKLDNYLKINVGSGTDVVVKLMKKGNYTDECIRIVYVRSSDVFEIKNIPEGQYYLKIAYGKDYRKKIIDNICYVKFMQNSQYEKGTEILDFNKIKQPDKVIGNIVYENWRIPSFELSLDVVFTNKNKNTFKANDISETEFNR